MADPDLKPKTLKDLQKEVPSREEVMSRLAMAQLAPDYEAATLSAALLEYMLQQAITARFIPLGKSQLDGLFADSGNGPLATFSSKIKVSYALGIIGPETRQQAERIRTIRNHFAHHKDKSSFDDAVVMAECGKFKDLLAFAHVKEIKEARSSISAKLRYVQCCLLTSAALSN